MSNDDDDDDRLFGEDAVIKRTTLFRTTLWRLMRAKRFPASVQLSPGRVAWRRSSILNWMRDLD